MDKTRKNFYISASENAKLSVTVYEAKEQKAVIQMVYGMCDHILKYKEVAERLVKNGYTVVISDLRGHGRSVSSSNELGYFGEDGVKNLVNDQVKINAIIRKLYPDTPIYMVGYSLGTMIARNFIQKYDDLIDKLILVEPPPFIPFANMGVVFFKTLASVYGSKSHSRLTRHLLSYLANEDKDKWPIYQSKDIKQYYSNLNNGFLFTNEGFKTLGELNVNLHKYKNYLVKNKDLNILFVCGKNDFVVGSKRYVNDSIKTLVKVGYNKITFKEYDKVDHSYESIISSKELMKDINDYLSK